MASLINIEKLAYERKQYIENELNKYKTTIDDMISTITKLLTEYGTYTFYKDMYNMISSDRMDKRWSLSVFDLIKPQLIRDGLIIHEERKQITISLPNF
jgi:hypothetical protein